MEGNPESVKPVQMPVDDHLQKIEDGIMSNIPEDLQDDLERIVVSGRQVIYNKKTHKDIMNGMRDIDDPNDARKVALGVAAILTIINREAKTPIPVELMVPAGVLITVDVVRFLVETNRLDVDPSFTGNAVEDLLAALMQKMGLGKKSPPPSGDTRVPANSVPPPGPQAGPPQAPPGQPQGLIGAAA